MFRLLFYDYSGFLVEGGSETVGGERRYAWFLAFMRIWEGLCVSGGIYERLLAVMRKFWNLCVFGAGYAGLPVIAGSYEGLPSTVRAEWF